MNLTAIQGNIVSIGGNLLAMDARKPLIIEVDTRKGSGFNTFTLPLTNHTTDIYVKTSDGQRFTISNYLDSKRTIAFASAGVYTIELRGQCGWSFNNTGDCQKLTKIISWGDFLFIALVYGFYGCINLTTIPQTGSINTTAINLSWMFVGCNKLACQIPPELLYRAPNCASLTYLFFGCLYLNGQIPDYFLSKVPKLVWAAGIFHDCQRLSPYIPQRLLWDVPKITTIMQLFFRCFIANEGAAATIPTEFCKNNPNITDMSSTYRLTAVSGVFPADYFNYTPRLNNVEYMLQVVGRLNVTALNIPIAVIPNITKFNSFLEASNGRATGSIQDIWTYASPTATKVNAFKNQIQLTNYNDIHNEWKGL